MVKDRHCWTVDGRQKAAFLTRAQAKDRARHWHGSTSGITFYYCVGCRGWHISTVRRKRAQWEAARS